MSLIVMKFGGTSVADPARISQAAGLVAREVACGHTPVVVVSAMAGVTNQLVGYTTAVGGRPDTPDYDAVVSSGENVTAGLMALALQQCGLRAQSFQGWQVPVMTDDTHGRARVLKIPPDKVMAAVRAGMVPVVAGFQGVGSGGRITTLGRGGSDTSAVALAAALQAERCDIYTDVDGVYTTDPRLVRSARKISRVSFEEMLELATRGAKVLMNRSVELAMKWRVPTQVLSTFDGRIGSDLPGTLLAPDEVLEQAVVRGVALNRAEAKITLLRVPDQPGIAAQVFGPLAAAQINVDMIVQNIAPDRAHTDITFTVPRSDAARVEGVLGQVQMLQTCERRIDGNVAKVSVVGIGISSHVDIAAKMFSTLAAHAINIQVISTSEIRISVLIDESQADLAVRVLHDAFGLDGGGRAA